MGRNRKEFKKPEELFGSMSKFLVPENILKDFDITDLIELRRCWYEAKLVSGYQKFSELALHTNKG